MILLRRVPRFAFILSLAAVAFVGCGDEDQGFGPITLEIADVVIVVQPTDATAGASVAPAVSVELRDADGDVITTATDAVAIAFGTNPASGTLSGTTSADAVAGVATFSDLSIDKAGSGYTLVATLAALSDESSAFTISPAAPVQLGLASQPTGGMARTNLASFTVEIQDQFGNLTGGTDVVTVAFNDNPGAMVFHASGNNSPDLVMQLVDPITPEVFPALPDSQEAELFGLVYDATTDKVLAVEISSELLSIDAVTGAVDTIGNHGIDDLRGLAFEQGGAMRLFASQPFVNEFYELNPITAVATLMGPLTIAGDLVTAINGLATDPTNGTLYGIVQLQGAPNRKTRDLVTIDVGTLAVTSLGTLSEDGVSSLAFLPDGTLLATTGDGATNPESLWTVNKTDASMTLVIVMGDGDDGEAIATIPALLSGTLTVGAVNGVSTFSDIAINAPANGYTLIVTAPGLTGVTSAAFNITIP